MMKAANKKLNKSQGVSLPPALLRDGVKRAEQLDVTFSKYVQRLIKTDLSRKLLSVPADGV